MKLPTLPGLIREHRKADFDAMLRWIASALRMEKQLPGVMVRRPMGFVYRSQPSVS